VFVKGLVALLPTAVTIIVLVKLYELVSGTVGNGLRWMVVRAVALAVQRDAAVVEKWIPSVVGVILAIVIIYFVGLMLALFIGRRLWVAVEDRLRRLPIINAIYPAVKQVTDFFLEDNKAAFGRVVAVEYPRKGIYSIGFVTSRGFDSTESISGRQMLSVFMPSSPTPFTGYCIQVARDEVYELGIPVDVALKYIISGGVIPPPGQAEQGGDVPEGAAAEIGGTGHGEDGNKEK
jgi:uncharacterized membrane protein